MRHFKKVMVGGLGTFVFATGCSTNSTDPQVKKEHFEEFSQQQQEMLEKRNDRIGQQAQTIEDYEETLKAYEQKIAEAQRQLWDYQQEIEFLSKKASELKDIRMSQASKISQLKNNLSDKQATIRDLKNQTTVIELNETVLFDSAKTSISEEGVILLEQIGSMIETIENHHIVVEGHTDAWPINNEDFQSNWELGAQRATNVVDFLLQNTDISPKIISAKSMGPHHPLMSNNTEEGRQQNRRIEIRLVPQLNEQKSDVSGLESSDDSQI